MTPPPARDPGSERLDHRAQQVCSAAGTLIEYWGFKSILGRVWTYLALRAVALPQTEIADSLGVSKSLVSGAITELAALGLVRPVGEGRNAPWEAVMDVWPVISDVLRTREWLLLESTRVALEQALEESQAGGPGSYDARRMELIRDMVGAVQRLLGIVISIRMPGSATGVQEWIATATALIESLRAFGNAGKDDRRP